MIRIGILTASDKGSKGQREDKSAQVIRKRTEALGPVVSYAVVEDDRRMLQEKMLEMIEHEQVTLLFTTGGTGFSKRDVTPEATRDIIERETPGLTEAMRAHSMTITPRAMLSRAVSGIRKDTLIINLPGSPKACSESLDVLLESLEHGMEILSGDVTECAR